ncbi:hypothetical protein EO95_18495 [Methanosarcina sp. 1.H.T.1A.1]|nr:hypothetical protein EO95_18495 [Methanosarcina sp. 1.H.T.1A.1]
MQGEVVSYATQKSNIRIHTVTKKNGVQNCLPCPKGTFLKTGNQFLISAKYQCLRQLVWRPFPKEKSRINGREMKTEI